MEPSGTIDAARDWAALPQEIGAADRLVDELFRANKLKEALLALENLNNLQKAARLPDRARTLRNWAILLRDTRDLEAAARKTEELTAEFPQYAPGWNTRGQILERTGDVDGAIASFERALATYRDAGEGERAGWSAARPQWMLSLGNALRKQERQDEAVEAFRELIVLDPNNANAHNALGLALAASDPAGAMEQYSEADRLWAAAASPDRKYALTNWATILTDQGNPEQAEEKLRAALTVAPGDATIHNSLGLALEKRDPEAAIAEFAEADRLWAEASSPDRKYALRNWANVLIDQSATSNTALTATKLELAEEKLRMAVGLDPANADALNDLGRAMEKRDPEGAAKEYEEAARLWEKAGSPDCRFALRNWALLLANQGNFAEVEEKLRAAVAADLADVGSLTVLGEWLMQQGRYEEAVAEFQKARAVKESTSGTEGSLRDILSNLGNALLSRERFSEALAAFRSALDLPPDDASAHFQYAYGLSAMGEHEKALAEYDEAIRRSPAHPSAYNNKAELLFQLGRYAEGWKALDEAAVRFEAFLRELVDEERINLAVFFAVALRDNFGEFDRSRAWLDKVLAAKDDYSSAVWHRAILMRRMARESPSNATLQVESGEAARRAAELLLEGAKRPNGIEYLLISADLLIEERDWPHLEQTLATAEKACGELRVQRSEILVRRGILLLATEKPQEAAGSFSRALNGRGEDFAVMTYLGQAQLNASQYDAALESFDTVLERAPGNVGALIGSARACIELADEGNVDLYEKAQEFLDKVLRYGRGEGSVRLRGVDLADILYLRGYARTRLYDADKSGFHPALLLLAANDFRKARMEDAKHKRADTAYRKVTQQIVRRASRSTFDTVATVLVSLAAAMVFVFAQLDFFLRGTRLHRALGMPASSMLEKPASYAAVTFGALVILIAGLSLRKLLKLKVGGVELEKSSVEPTAAALLNIGRNGLFESFSSSSLRGLSANAANISTPAKKPQKEQPNQAEKPTPATA